MRHMNTDTAFLTGLPVRPAKTDQPAQSEHYHRALCGRACNLVGNAVPRLIS